MTNEMERMERRVAYLEHWTKFWQLFCLGLAAGLVVCLYLVKSGDAACAQRARDRAVGAATRAAGGIYDELHDPDGALRALDPNDDRHVAYYRGRERFLGRVGSAIRGKE